MASNDLSFIKDTDSLFCIISNKDIDTVEAPKICVPTRSHCWIRTCIPTCFCHFDLVDISLFIIFLLVTVDVALIIADGSWLASFVHHRQRWHYVYLGLEFWRTIRLVHRCWYYFSRDFIQSVVVYCCVSIDIVRLLLQFGAKCFI